MNDIFIKRLKKLRLNNKWTQAKLAKKVGVSQQAVGNWETKKNSPDPEVLLKLAELFGVSLDYLLGNSPYPLSNEIAVPVENRRVPIIRTVRCGPGGLAYEYLDGYVSIDESVHGDIRAFRCSGDSMSGSGIADGDIAIVRIQDDVENGELAVVVINGDEGTLKRVRKEDGVLVLEADNPAYPARIFAGQKVNTVRIVGKVIEVRKKF